jgi:hypothetical protein
MLIFSFGFRKHLDWISDLFLRQTTHLETAHGAVRRVEKQGSNYVETDFMQSFPSLFVASPAAGLLTTILGQILLTEFLKSAFVCWLQSAD